MNQHFGGSSHVIIRSRAAVVDLGSYVSCVRESYTIEIWLLHTSVTFARTSEYPSLLLLDEVSSISRLRLQACDQRWGL